MIRFHSDDLNQYSSRGETIWIPSLSGELLFIDPVYLAWTARIKYKWQFLPRENTMTFLKQIEQMLFPGTGGSRFGFKSLEKDAATYDLKISAIAFCNDVVSKAVEIRIQEVDTKIPLFEVVNTSFLIIDMANFDKLLALLNVDELLSLKNYRLDAIAYIEKISRLLGNKGWAYVVSPDIPEAFDFKGNGSYYISDTDPLDYFYAHPRAKYIDLFTDDPDLLESALKQGADPNLDPTDGWTPMHDALDNAIQGMIQDEREAPYPEHLKLIKILVSYGADFDKKNALGENPLRMFLSYASDEYHFNLLKDMFREVIPDIDSKIHWRRNHI